VGPGSAGDAHSLGDAKQTGALPGREEAVKNRSSRTRLAPDLLETGARRGRTASYSDVVRCGGALSSPKISTSHATHAEPLWRITARATRF
jgi:hypothetical protein